MTKVQQLITMGLALGFTLELFLFVFHLIISYFGESYPLEETLFYYVTGYTFIMAMLFHKFIWNKR